MLRHQLRRQSMMQMRAHGGRQPLQGCFSSPEPGSWSPASPGILRALQETTEPDGHPPRDNAASPKTSQSTPSDRGASPWTWTSPERTRDGTAVQGRSGDTQSGEHVEEEVPLVDVSRAGQGSQDTQGHSSDKV